MLTKNQSKNRMQAQIISIEDVVPENHLVRQIEQAINFTFIYEQVSHLYSQAERRPSVDPVVLFKIILIKYIFGIRSIRQTIKEIEVNMAYRWFLGYGMTQRIPHFTTFGKNYERRFKDTDVFEQIFMHILNEAVRMGFIDAAEVFIDATHIKASANKNKATNEAVEIKAKHYHAELMEEINRDRAAHGKKPLKNKNDKDDNDNEANNGNNPTPAPTKNTKVSKTDPESGLFHKGEHEKMFAYTAHTACDKHGFVLGCDVSPGNVHDRVMFDSLYANVLNAFPEMEAVDSGYRTPWIMKQIFDSKRIAAVPYKRPMTKEGFFKKHEYV
ncbi:MAG: transposase, partial [Defluviitaleaceae bacterium]|nr:transposase [Defluviitaleaceae bacterium]